MKIAILNSFDVEIQNFGKEIIFYNEKLFFPI